MSKTRPVKVRVDEFRKSKKSKRVRITYDEFGEILEMFGVAAHFCNVFDIINTAFYLGYIKGMRPKKGGNGK